MFDVGFWEMAFIGVIALVVIGPQRLPGVARSVGMWVGKGRRMIADVKSDVKKEMNAHDLAAVKEFKDELTSASKDFKNMAESTTASVDKSIGLKDEANQIKNALDGSSKKVSKKRGSKKPKGNKSGAKTSGAKKSAGKKATAKKAVAKNSGLKKKAAGKRTAQKKAATKPAVKANTKKTSTKKTSAKKAPVRKPSTTARSKKTKAKTMAKTKNKTRK